MNPVRTTAALLLGFVLVAAPGLQAQDKGGLGGAPAKAPNDMNAQLPIRVNQAIDSGVEWLKKQQFAPGNWNPEVTSDIFYDPNAKGDAYVHPTGCTSLSLYALLKCGVSKDDPVIKKGFDWLKNTSGGITKGKALKTAYRIPNGTYELATLILAIEARANPHKLESERERELKFRLKKGEKLKTDVKLEPDDQKWMKDLLAELLRRRNPGKGWRYGMFNGQVFYNGPRGDSDLSASNLTMLAVVAAERCGFPQPDDFYASVLKWTLSLQEGEKDAPEMPRWDPSLKEDDRKYGVGKDHARGFGYIGIAEGGDRENIATSSMTSCGLANIVICTSVLEARESKAYTGELQKAAEKAWWDGVAWLDFHWTVTSNVGANNYHYYYLYCLERGCDMKRIHLIAGHPWYNEGALVLVNDQLSANTGAWTKQDTHRPCDILNTCFALLFLNRATPAITGD